MRSVVSPHVSDNLSLIQVLCNPLTSTKATSKILKNITRPLILAIQELLLNVKQETLPKVIVAIKNKKQKLKFKKQQIIKHWKKIRALITPLVGRLIQNGTAQANP